jgi:TonB-linked SusC/RagA family outer membrane protein
MKRLLLKTIFLCLTAVLSCAGLPAQNDGKNTAVTVSGTVYEGPEQPVQGVTVYLKDRPGVGWVTDMNGRFSVKAEIRDVLIFSMLGFEEVRYDISRPEENLRIDLVPSNTELEEMVIVGMGSQRRISVVGAVTSVNVADLQMPATSINNVLGGRVPGIISIQRSGEPGKNISEFWIRGIGTFGGGKDALVLVDGLEGKLNQIDPADIESFSILKDASATAVYGVRGANGVILITTKHGENDRLRITLRSNLTLSYLNNMPEYLNAYDYAQLANEASAVSGNQPRYTDIQMDLIKYGLDPDLYPDVNWQEEILRRTSWQNTHYLSARGGGSIARYFVSLGMSSESAAYKQESISKYRKKIGYNTYSYRMNIDMNVTKTTAVYMGLDGFIDIKNRPGEANTDWLWSSQAKLTPLTVPTKYSNGMLPAYGKDDEISPYVLLNYTGMTTDESYKNMVTIAVNQDFGFLLDGLKGKIQGAFDSQAYLVESRRKMPDLYNTSRRNTAGELVMIKRVNAYDVQYSKDQNQWRKYHLEANLNYDRLIAGDHRLGGLLYYYMSNEYKTAGVSSSMQAIPRRYQGLSSRITYGYRDTYMIDGNFGYTGSENFKKGERFGFFPSVAVGWVPSHYGWVRKKIPFISFLKIRASYGTVGNDRIDAEDRFPYLTIINSNAAGGWGGQGLIESVVGADNLAWEVAKKADLGIEARLLNSRIEFVVDIFRDTRDGIFQRRTQLPAWVGSMTMPYGNVGSMVSYGADGNISYTHNFKKGTGFTLRANFTYSTNEIRHWEQPYQEYGYLSYVDKPYDVLRGFKAVGLFRDENEIRNSPEQFGTVRPGDIKYKDVTGDGVITDDDMIPLSYSPMPRLMYGFGAELRVKDFTLGVLLKGTGHTDFYMNGNGYGYIPFHGGDIGNVLSIAKDQANRWTPAWYSGDPATENPDARFPRLSYGYNANNSKPSSFWIGNSSYLRLSEVSMNYNLKNGFLMKSVGISSIDLQLTGYDLAVWDSVKIWDPELATSNGYAYPIPARFAFQLYINF